MALVEGETQLEFCLPMVILNRSGIFYTFWHLFSNNETKKGEKVLRLQMDEIGVYIYIFYTANRFRCLLYGLYGDLRGLD